MHEISRIDDVRTVFPDRFGIKDKLRTGTVQNPEFLTLTLKAYDLRLRLHEQELSIAESIKTSENVSVFDHQILAALKIKNELGGSGILADEVGLGKTVEAGILIKEFLVTGLAKNVLILAPPSLLPQWRDEMSSKFDLDFAIHRDDPRFQDIQSHNLLLMSHSSAIYPRQSVPLNSTYWDMVIVDEAHSMKNAATNKHRLVRGLPKRNLLLLTATPIQNNLEEMYNLIELLRPGCLGTWAQFRSKYVADAAARKMRPLMRDELQRILSKFVIRTTRNEARRYIKFTDRIPHTRILTPGHYESSLYNAITDVVRTQYKAGGDTLALMIYQRLASSSTAASKRALYKMKGNGLISEEIYRKLVSTASAIQEDSKLSELKGIIGNSRSKFLIFTEFYATQDYIAGHLQKNGHSVTLFNGRMSPEEKRESVTSFKNDARVMVSTSAGGEGQNFQFCHNIVNYDLPWNPMRVEQRIGRVHRIGQKDDVHIFNLALSGTIEAHILELLYMKINLFRMALGDMDLMFEDSWAGGSPRTWFTEYMGVANEQEQRNRFSALGDDWSAQKERAADAVQDFNAGVFRNFDLSVLKEKAS
ncbi:MAG: SNF2-related protein [Thaumarchaeota archaeon]|nr:SNF2-related protein [Nitrososphaerota archaeon]